MRATLTNPAPKAERTTVLMARLSDILSEIEPYMVMGKDERHTRLQRSVCGVNVSDGLRYSHESTLP